MSNIFVGDNNTLLEFTVQDDNGIVDLSSAKEIKFRMKKQGQYVEKVATISDAVEGKCELKLSNTDTDRQGNYTYQLQIEFYDGSVFTSSKQQLSILGKV